LRQKFLASHDFRLLIVHKKDEDIQNNIYKAIEAIDNSQSKTNIYFSSGKKQGKLGFLFPGQGSQYTDMGKDLVSVFPEALKALEQATDIFSHENNENSSELKPLNQYIFPPPTHLQTKTESEDQLRKTNIAQPAIGAISLGMINILKRFGIKPEITCGHSFGELSALCSADWMNEESFLSLSAARGKYMADAGLNKDSDPGSMLAVQTSIKDIEALIKDEKLDLILANRNSEKQGVLSGATNEILRAQKICKQKKLRAVKLPVAAAFHSKLIQNAVTPFKKYLSSKIFSPTPVDVLSNTTGKPYAKKESEIKKILGNQLVNPVNFVENIEGMLDKKVSVFLEVGPKAVLTGLTKSILKEHDITAISLDKSSGINSGIEDLAHALCMIASKGFAIDLSPWEDAAKKVIPKKMKVQICGANLKPKNRCSIPKSKPKIEPTHKQTFNENRSALKGSDMTYQNAQQNNIDNLASPSYEAMKMVQKGLEAMQQLQTQTANAHEKFLETQAQASKTLASMMEQTRNFASGATATPITPETVITEHITTESMPRSDSISISNSSISTGNPVNFATTLKRICSI